MITVLSVSFHAEDHEALERAIQGSGVTLYPNCRVMIVRCSDPTSLSSLVRRSRIPIVICDAGGTAGGWTQVAQDLRGLPESPSLILACELADERVCAEGLKHGVYEVLSKPLRNLEVLRIINLAWRHWQERYGLGAEVIDNRTLTGTDPFGRSNR